MKNVTLLAVKYAALLLIEKNEMTTTLEVKGLLRELNYFAEQFEISSFMDTAAQELPLEFTTHRGQHRVYTLPEVSTISVIVDDDDTDDDDDTGPSLTTVITTIVATGDDDTSLTGISQALQDAADVKYNGRFNELVLMYDDAATIHNLGGLVTRVSTGAGRTFYYTQPVRRELARSAHASTLGIHKNRTCSSAVTA